MRKIFALILAAMLLGCAALAEALPEDAALMVADALVSDGFTTVTVEHLPEDFAPLYAVEGLDMFVGDGNMVFVDAMPGTYTLTVTDESETYADTLSADFVLSTEALPVAYDAEAGAIAVAENMDETLARTFIANITSVEVNGEAYPAVGEGAVTIVGEDGAIDIGAEVFGEAGSYELTVTAMGFTQPLVFTLEL